MGADMTDPIRDAAQALLDAHDRCAPIGEIVAGWDALRAALSAPQPAADERVAEHMLEVREYGQRAVTHHINCGSDVMDTLRKRNEQLAVVESSARAMLAAGREDAETIKPERVRHVVSGRLYDLIGDATVQSDSPLTDMMRVRLYRGDDGKYWVRPIREFSARFVAAEPGPVAAQKGTP